MRIVTLLSLILLTVQPALATDVDNMPAAQAEFAKGRKLYDAKKYKDAQKQLDKAAKLGSRDSTIQYYLAMAALQNSDYETFKRAMARVIATKHPKRGIGYEARNILLRYVPGCEPYPCISGATGNLSRFIKADFPVKVYITPGLMLPEPFRGREGLRPDQMTLLMRQIAQGPAFYQTLQKDPAYDPGFAHSIVQGLQTWEWARAEGLIDYRIVNNPVEANIVVFWCPQLERQHTAFTQAMAVSNIGRKIVMQVATNDKNKLSTQFLTWIAAHEFGHCWGLSNHSLNDKDLMSANANLLRPHGQFSENDKLTMRALYDLAPTVRR